MGVDVRELLRVRPGPVDLAAIDPASTPGVPRGEGKRWARGQLAELGQELERAQEMLYANARVSSGASRRVLLLLQGMDCSGKGGAVRRVVGFMNPQGVRVAAFGPPTEQERREHFLRRIVRALPAYGLVGVFDRSHYEDVLIARVRSLVPESVWRGRYDEINEWEEQLVSSGTSLVKVMLHVSYQEQTRRLRARLDDATKHWKFDPSDIDERKRWSDYQQAYADVLQRCQVSGWYVVPADRKWYRNWAIAHLLRATFAELDLRYPPATFDVAEQRRRLAATFST